MSEDYTKHYITLLKDRSHRVPNIVFQLVVQVQNHGHSIPTL